MRVLPEVRIFLKRVKRKSLIYLSNYALHNMPQFRKVRIQFTLNNKVRTFQNPKNSLTPKTSFDPFSASCFSSFCSSPKSLNTDVLMNFCNPPSQPTKPNQTKLTNPATGHLVHSIRPAPAAAPGGEIRRLFQRLAELAVRIRRDPAPGAAVTCI